MGVAGAMTPVTARRGGPGAVRAQLVFQARVPPPEGAFSRVSSIHPIDASERRDDEPWVQVNSPLPPVLQPLADLPGSKSGTTSSATPERRGGAQGVRVSLSEEARRRSDGEATDASGRAAPTGASGEALSQEDQRALAELQQRDREVRAHEAAHQAAAGDLARGGASFTYETGPDGQRYAVAGEVKIDASPVPGDPAATERKMQRVRAAALAPADPSSQDRSVAATASRESLEASAEAAAASRAAGPEQSAAPDAAPLLGAERAASAEEARRDGTRAPNALERMEDDATSATGGCPVCQAQGHGPEHHRGDVDTFA